MSDQAQPASGGFSGIYHPNEFDNSRLFWLYSTPTNTSGIPSIDALTHSLSKELFQRDESLTQSHLWLVLRDLAVNWLQDERQYLAIHLNKTRYSPGTLFHYRDFKYDPTRKVVMSLIRAKLIDFQRGFYNRTSGTGRLSRIRATESLNKAFASARVLQDINAVYPIFKPLELIEIRDLNKMATHFVPSLEIKLMTDAVARYNDALEQANIDITLDKYQYPVKIDLTRKFVRRIFNNYSIESGGRLAGAWWLSCPSDARSRILIGRLETIEIDLKGLHPVLLYAEAGIDYFDEMGHDPYSVCDVEGVMGRCINSEDKAQYRSFFKQMFLVLINNIDEDKAKAALKKEMNVSNELCRRAGRDIPYPEQLSDARFNLFWDTFKECHNPIRQSFAGSGGSIPASLRLMRIDSDYIMQVLMAMLDHNVVCLSVHDSLIVPYPHEPLAKRVINDVFEKVMTDKGIRPVMPRSVKTGFYKIFTPNAKESYCQDMDLQVRAKLKRPQYLNYFPI